MFNLKINNLLNNVRWGKWLLASAAAAALALPSVARADSRFDHREPDRRIVQRHDFDRHDYDRHEHGGFVWRLDIGFPIVFPAPAYQTVVDRVWVEPVYQTTTESVWVPDQFQDRTVTFWDRGRLCTGVEHVLVAPAHFEDRQTQVCVSEGHWETVTRQVPVDGF